jgi:hypothetical protein
MKQNKIIRFEYIKTKILKAYHKKIKNKRLKYENDPCKYR